MLTPFHTRREMFVSYRRPRTELDPMLLLMGGAIEARRPSSWLSVMLRRWSRKV